MTVIVYLACSNFTSSKESNSDLLVNIGNPVLVLQSFQYVLLQVPQNTSTNNNFIHTNSLKTGAYDSVSFIHLFPQRLTQIKTL